MLSGKKGVSPGTAETVAAGLNLTPEETEFFVSSATALHARDKGARNEARKKLTKLSVRASFSSLTKPQFSVLNEWYYLTLLQVFELKDFEPSLDWVSEKLGLIAAEVENSLRELKRAGLIRETRGFYSPVNNFVKTAEIPSRQIRTHLQRMMKLASDALETQSIDERDFSSTVFPIDPGRMNEFKEEIREFREKFCRKASKCGHLSDVYNLSIQFFRVSKPKPNTGAK